MRVLALVRNGEVQSSSIDTIELLRVCVADREHSAAWHEFLRRILPKLRVFIRGSLRQSTGGSRESEAYTAFHPDEVDDLVQVTLVRLVEHDCALLRGFSGRTEQRTGETGGEYFKLTYSKPASPKQMR